MFFQRIACARLFTVAFFLTLLMVPTLAVYGWPFGGGVGGGFDWGAAEREANRLREEAEQTTNRLRNEAAGRANDLVNQARGAMQPKVDAINSANIPAILDGFSNVVAIVVNRQQLSQDFFETLKEEVDLLKQRKASLQGIAHAVRSHIDELRNISREYVGQLRSVPFGMGNGLVGQVESIVDGVVNGVTGSLTTLERIINEVDRLKNICDQIKQKQEELFSFDELMKELQARLDQLQAFKTQYADMLDKLNKLKSGALAFDILSLGAGVTVGGLSKASASLRYKFAGSEQSLALSSFNVQDIATHIPQIVTEFKDRFFNLKAPDGSTSSVQLQTSGRGGPKKTADSLYEAPVLNDTYKHFPEEWKLPEPGKGAVVFKANPVNDLHVLFYHRDQKGQERPDPAYEIVFGGWENTKSAIRRAPQKPEVFANDRKIFSVGSFATYWAMINKDNNTVSFGLGGFPGQNTIISYVDPHFMFAHQYVTFSSWDKPITYKDIKFVSAKVTSYDAPVLNDTYKYFPEDWKLPEAGKGAVVFKANPVNDLHVLFYSAAQKGKERPNPAYELVLGGWENTRSAVRRAPQGSELFFNDSRIQTVGRTANYWAMVDKDTKQISLGLGTVPGQNVLIDCTDQNFLSSVQYVSFSTWDKPISYSNVKITPSQQLIPSKYEARVVRGAYPNKPQLWKLFEPGQGAVLFKASAARDIHVLFYSEMKSGQDSPSNAYELLLGGWGNGRSVIRSSIGGKELCFNDSSIKDVDAFADYWAMVNKDTKEIAIGLGTVPGQNTLIFYADQNFKADVQYVAFSSWDNTVFYKEIRFVPAQRVVLPAYTADALRDTYPHRPEEWRLSEKGKGTVIFKANTKYDICVLFYRAEQRKELRPRPSYEMIHAGWVNTRSVIRYTPPTPEDGSTELVALNTKLARSTDDYWATVDKTRKVLAFGTGTVPGQNTIMSCKDPNFIDDVQYVAFSTWDTPVSYSDIRFVN